MLVLEEREKNHDINWEKTPRKMNVCVTEGKRSLWNTVIFLNNNEDMINHLRFMLVS